MILGRVTEDGRAQIPIAIYDADSSLVEVLATIDTGFDGFVSLPSDILRSMKLTPYAEVEITLADASSRKNLLYNSSAFLDGRTFEISIHELDPEPLVGMSFLGGFRLTVDVLPDGKVEVVALT